MRSLGGDHAVQDPWGLRQRQPDGPDRVKWTSRTDLGAVRVLQGSGLRILVLSKLDLQKPILDKSAQDPFLGQQGPEGVGR